MTESPEGTAEQLFDVVVIGAGPAGMYAIYKLRRLGFTVHGIERGSDVGGTWYWNRYPGARCDADSIYYSFGFSDELQQEWTWTQRFAPQAEILAYLNHVADRFDLRRDISFDTTVLSVVRDDDSREWVVELDNRQPIRARYVICAVGNLSAAQIPAIEGIDSFAGEEYHTSRWPHEGVDLRGKRVGVIGTGSTGIQLITAIAPIAGQVTVYQRTPNYSVPARNRPLTTAEIDETKANYRAIREACKHSPGGTLMMPTSGKSALDLDEAQQRAEMDKRWNHGGADFLYTFTDIMRSQESNDIVSEYVREHIRAVVRDPETAADLCPTDYPLGGKRICLDSDYFEVYNRDNVELVNLRKEPISRITPTGVATDQAQRAHDVLIFATGFDAMTGPILRLNIQGSKGALLKDAWHAGPRTYLGLGVAGFPNLFIVTGPGSPSVLSNMMTTIEQHIDWISDTLVYLRAHGMSSIEADLAAQDEWVDHVNEVAAGTLMFHANSWFLGANIPGKPRVFMPYMGGVGPYRDLCDEVAADGYRGFVLSE
jgi:cyclohexanone monooxygenase